MDEVTLVNIADESEVYDLKKGMNIVGRSINEENDVSIPDKYRRVSRKHCGINWKDGGLVVGDTKSTHGTYVNGKKIKEAPLKSGDKLGLGLEYVLEVRIEGAEIRLAD